MTEHTGESNAFQAGTDQKTGNLKFFIGFNSGREKQVPRSSVSSTFVWETPPKFDATFPALFLAGFAPILQFLPT
jgi:hypothetical protein